MLQTAGRNRCDLTQANKTWLGEIVIPASRLRVVRLSSRQTWRKTRNTPTLIGLKHGILAYADTVWLKKRKKRRLFDFSYACSGLPPWKVLSDKFQAAREAYATLNPFVRTARRSSIAIYAENGEIFSSACTSQKVTYIEIIETLNQYCATLNQYYLFARTLYRIVTHTENFNSSFELCFVTYLTI